MISTLCCRCHCRGCCCLHQVTKGIALVDLLAGLQSLVLMMDIDQRVQAFTIEKMADLEHRLSVSTSERIQLGSLVGIFATARAQLSE